MGNVLTATDRKSQVTTYHYDALNRPSLITYAGGSTVTPTYDAGNRLTQVVDSVSGVESDPSRYSNLAQAGIAV